MKITDFADGVKFRRQEWADGYYEYWKLGILCRSNGGRPGLYRDEITADDFEPYDNPPAPTESDADKIARLERELQAERANVDAADKRAVAWRNCAAGFRDNADKAERELGHAREGLKNAEAHCRNRENAWSNGAERDAEEILQLERELRSAREEIARLERELKGVTSDCQRAELEYEKQKAVAREAAKRTVASNERAEKAEQALQIAREEITVLREHAEEDERDEQALCERAEKAERERDELVASNKALGRDLKWAEDQCAAFERERDEARERLKRAEGLLREAADCTHPPRLRIRDFLDGPMPAPEPAETLPRAVADFSELRAGDVVRLGVTGEHFVLRAVELEDEGEKWCLTEAGRCVRRSTVEDGLVTLIARGPQ